MKADIPTMSGNQFEYLARTLGKSLAECGFCRADVAMILKSMIPMLSLTNERFNEDKFVTAVKGWYSIHNNIHDKE